MIWFSIEMIILILIFGISAGLCWSLWDEKRDRRDG